MAMLVALCLLAPLASAARPTTLEPYVELSATDLIGATTTYALPNALVPGILGSVWLPNVSTLGSLAERKVAAVAMTRLLCETPTMLEQANVWQGTLAALLPLLAGIRTQAEEDADDDDDFEDEGRNQGSAFSKLHNAAFAEPDVTAAIPDAQAFLAQSLGRLCAAAPGRVPPMATAALEPTAVIQLQTLCAGHGVTLS